MRHHPAKDRASTCMARPSVCCRSWHRASTYDQWPLMSTIGPTGHWRRVRVELEWQMDHSSSRGAGTHGGCQTVWCDKTTSAARLCKRTRVRLDRGQGSSDWHRGFVWQPLGATQRIWSEPSASLGRASAWRIHACTEFPGPTDRHRRWCRWQAPLSTLSAVVRSMNDPARLELASTLHVHAGNEGWAPPADRLYRAPAGDRCQAHHSRPVNGHVVNGRRKQQPAAPPPASARQRRS